MAVSAMVQGFSREDDVEAIIKGNAKDIARIINRSIEVMAEEMDTTYEDIVRKLISMRNKERDELMPYTRSKEEREPITTTLDLSNVKKKYQRDAVDASYEESESEPKPKSKAPVSRPVLERSETVAKAKAKETKARIKQAPVKLFAEEPEPEEDDVVFEPLAKIMPRLGIPEAYAQRVEYVMPGGQWFAYKYNGRVQNIPEGTYYVIVEKKYSTTPKERIQVYVTAVIGGRFMFDGESGINLDDFRVIALSPYE